MFYRLSSRVYKDAGDEEPMEKERQERQKHQEMEKCGGFVDKRAEKKQVERARHQQQMENVHEREEERPVSQFTLVSLNSSE